MKSIEYNLWCCEIETSGLREIEVSIAINRNHFQEIKCIYMGGC